MKYILEEGTELYNKQVNKYSFPFNGGLNGSDIGIAGWLERLEPFKPFIHDIFLSCPEVYDFFSNKIISSNMLSYLDKCKELLKILKENNEYKTVVTLNGNYTNLTLQQKYEICNKAAEQIDKYNIYGCVVSNFDMAIKLHELLPNLVLNTSCNIPQYSLQSLMPWKQYANIEIINPSRNSSRNIPLLKEFKANGFKVKLLLNEPCDLSCPNIASYCAKSFDDKYICYGFRTKQSALHSCIVLPRWLNILDEYVDHYKLTGRYNKNVDFILKQFVFYLLRTDECFFSDFHPNYKGYLPLYEIPDKLLYCNGECIKNKCTLCNDIIANANNKMKWLFK